MRDIEPGIQIKYQTHDLSQYKLVFPLYKAVLPGKGDAYYCKKGVMDVSGLKTHRDALVKESRYNFTQTKL